MIYVRHDDGPGSGFSKGDDAFEIYDVVAPKEDEKIFDKNVNSAFHESTGLEAYLRSKNIKKIITVGLQTDYCIDATIKSGFEKGFEMIVPKECNSTQSNPYMDAETTYKFYNESMWPGRYAACPMVSETIEMIKTYKKSEISIRINACGTREVETDRLLIRPFKPDDAESILSSWGEIEYCIGRAYQGKGYATEATKAIIRYGFDKIGFNKIQICVRPSNIKSKRVIEKCGFEYEGTLRDYFFIDGKYEGRMYYSLLKD